MAYHGQHCSHGPKTTLNSREVPFLFNTYFKIEYSKIILIVLRKAKKNIQNITCYQILHPNLLVKSGRYLAGTGSEKIDRNRIFGRTLKKYDT